MMNPVTAIRREIMLVHLSLDIKSSLKLVVFLELLFSVLFKEKIGQVYEHNFALNAGYCLHNLHEKYRHFGVKHAKYCLMLLIGIIA